MEILIVLGVLAKIAGVLSIWIVIAAGLVFLYGMIMANVVVPRRTRHAHVMAWETHRHESQDMGGIV